MTKRENGRARLRDLGIGIGVYPTGELNAITDVPGVWVGQTTVIRDQPSVVRTGVTMIVPRDGEVYKDYCYAGYFSFNGAGEMTGLPLLAEWGMLTSPIALTNTNQVGLARDALARYGSHHFEHFSYKLAVAAETYDGWLSDIDSFPLTEADFVAALDTAAPGPVTEGCVGGGTGMICHEFKGGIGTSSRLIETAGERYTIGVLVQSNYGRRPQLRVDGVPVGEAISIHEVPAPWEQPPESSSIIVVVATDAPLLGDQCQRLARRATVGLGRTGGVGNDSSGDIFLAFATGNHYDGSAKTPVALRSVPHDMMTPMFHATAEAVEEAILNALTSAVTITGYQGHTAHALPLDRLVEVMRAAGRR